MKKKEIFKFKLTVIYINVIYINDQLYIISILLSLSLSLNLNLIIIFVNKRKKERKKNTIGEQHRFEIYKVSNN
jgi:hypothetical protein